MARWTVVDGKRRLRIIRGPHKRELRCNEIEVMSSEVVQVAGDGKGRCDRWDGEWRTGVRERNL
jgi:hypothetical protein